jgi:hypothetical protein
MSDSDSFVDKVVSVIPAISMPSIMKKKRKVVVNTLAARKKELGVLQKALGKLVKNVEKLAKSITTEEKKTARKPAVKRAAKKPVRKPAAKRK